MCDEEIVISRLDIRLFNDKGIGSHTSNLIKGVKQWQEARELFHLRHGMGKIGQWRLRRFLREGHAWLDSLFIKGKRITLSFGSQGNNSCCSWRWHTNPSDKNIRQEGINCNLSFNRTSDLHEVSHKRIFLCHCLCFVCARLFLSVSMFHLLPDSVTSREYHTQSSSAKVIYSVRERERGRKAGIFIAYL
jgi:hypothetical protein